MKSYRQHPLVLVDALVGGSGLVLLGALLASATSRVAPLLLLGGTGLLLLVWRWLRWWTFRLCVEGRQVTVRSFRWFVAYERLVSLNAPGGVQLRQNLAGWLCDYGTIRIEVFGTPVHVRYIYPFAQLQRQVDGQ